MCREEMCEGIEMHKGRDVQGTREELHKRRDAQEKRDTMGETVREETCEGRTMLDG